MSDYATIVSERLCIRSGEKRVGVSGQVHRKFNEALCRYIIKERKLIKIRPVSIIFQNPETPFPARSNFQPDKHDTGALNVPHTKGHSRSWSRQLQNQNLLSASLEEHFHQSFPDL